MSSSSDDGEIPQHLKDKINQMSDSSDEEEEDKNKKQPSSENKQEQKKEEETDGKPSEVNEQADKMKEKTLTGMELLKQKTEASKQKLQNLKELSKNPEDKEKLAAQLLKDAKDLKKDAEDIKNEGEDYKKEALAAAGTVGAAALGGTQRSSKDEETKSEEEVQEDDQQPSGIKPKKKREKQDLSFKLDSQNCLKYRKESYNELKDWDDKSQIYHNIHKAVCEATVSKLERKIKISIESMKQIILYFQNKAQFEHNNYKAHQQSLPKLNKVFKDVQDSNTIMYPVLAKAFQECDNMNDSQSKLVQIFANYIEKNILKDILNYDAADYEKKANIMLDKIKKNKEKIKSCFKEYNQNSQKYQKLYHDLTVTEEKSKKKDKDFYYNEIKFKKSALAYMKAQRTLGTNIWALWQDFKKLEIKRLEILQEVFKMYLEKYKLTYGELQSMNSAKEQWDKFKFLEEGTENFSLRAILSMEDISNVKKGLDKEEITIDDVEFFLSKFQSGEIDKYSKLVLQTFEMERDVGSVKKQFKNCEFVVTIDDFLLVFDDPQEFEIKKPNKKLQMNRVSVKKIKDKQKEIYVCEKIPGIVMNSTEKYLVRFEDEEQLDEFVGYVAQFNKVE